jgi:diguanylate cyclase (GGDEF)-like protein
VHKKFSTAGYLVSALQLFEGADHAGVARLLADCDVLQVTGGQVVSGGGHANLYIVLRGALSGASADASTGVIEGASTKFLPGECVGELSVLDEGSNPVLVTALEDSDVLVIKAEKLWELIDKSNGVARNLLRQLSFRVRAANAQVRRRQKVGEFYRQMSMVDGLTGLQNRAWLNDQLPLIVGLAQTTGRPLSIIMIDLDHFKRFNDSHGHQCGDSALQVAARVLTAALRPTDFAARYGGEEMMVILQHADQKAGMMVAQRLCERMRESIVFADMRLPLPHITASMGIATLASGQDADALVGAADAALYRAKDGGRDRVEA